MYCIFISQKKAHTQYTKYKIQNTICLYEICALKEREKNGMKFIYILRGFLKLWWVVHFFFWKRFEVPFSSSSQVKCTTHMCSQTFFFSTIQNESYVKFIERRLSTIYQMSNDIHPFIRNFLKIQKMNNVRVCRVWKVIRDRKYLFGNTMR